MKNYEDSDYALNKYSAGITYRFADGKTQTVTLADYLAENPAHSVEDFQILKELSDSDYLETVRNDNLQTRLDVSWEEMCSAESLLPSTLRYTPSIEDAYIRAIDMTESAGFYQSKLEVMIQAMDKLTPIQRRRYTQYHARGLSTWKIAKLEGTNQKTVYESLQAAEKKIKKFLKKI